MDDSSKLCVTCGLCCDGTAIGFVQLDKNEVASTRNVMDIEEEDGVGFFLHPCNKLGCDGCTIYNDRPKQCASFKCKLLKSVEHKELGVDSAIEITNTVKLQRASIQKKIEALQLELKSESFYFQMVELDKVLKKKEKESPLSDQLKELLVDFKELNLIMTDKFDLAY